MAELLLPLLVRDTAGAYGAARDGRVAAPPPPTPTTSWEDADAGGKTMNGGRERERGRKSAAEVHTNPLETAHPERDALRRRGSRGARSILRYGSPREPT